MRRVIRTLDDKRWQLSLRRNDVDDLREFDKVLICNGRTQDSVVPKVGGIEAFKRKILHSQAFMSCVLAPVFINHHN